MQTQIETHPVQNNHPNGAFAGIRIPKAVTMRAYEVYCHVYGPQEAMIDDEGRGCRGGFDILTEIAPFLYARSFPKEEWRRRVDEATKGMVLGKDRGIL